MAQAPLLQLSGITLTHGGNPVLDGISLIIHPGERAALVGRNGSGKSTLMKVMAGLVEPDSGSRVLPAGASVAYMEQHPDMRGHATLGDYAAGDLPPGEAWRVAQAAEGLKFDPATPVQTASGGERRRAALARVLASGADLLLLDEPTNHLDIEAIEWLEARLGALRAGFVLISHDRAFLTALTRTTLWLDRGTLRRRDAGFAGFEAWRDRIWEEEETARHKLDRKIKAEARWAVEGISARRKRNQGRLRALRALREERRAMIRRQGAAAMALEAGPKSGRKVIEALAISKAFGGKPIVKDFSLRIMRGDRVAFVGPNGVGKTTLLGMLTGEIAPDSGKVIHGSNLEIAVFDQNRSALDPDLSLWENLTADPAIGISGKSDQIMVRGTPRHVAGYLKDFLFDDTQLRSPVRVLSGGEKARLILARIMARESNLLVLDEPTNDLDIETLDLLQEVLGDYDGTVLLVSHDRDFIDRVATTTIAMEGDGKAIAYAGGWSDYRAQRGREQAPEKVQKLEKGRGAPSRGKSEKKRAPARGAREESAGRKQSGLTFTERHRLEALPAEIARPEAETAKLSDLLADPGLFSREPVKFAKASEMLSARQAALQAAEEEWLRLEEKAEAGGAESGGG